MLSEYSIHSLFRYLVILTFITIVFVDLKEMIIPDTLILFDLILIVVYFIIYDRSLFIQFNFISFEIISSVIFCLLMLLIVVFIHINYKTEVLGYGDIKLIFIMGLLSGITCLMVGLFCASIIALIFQIKNIKRKKEAFPFGPYLVIGFVVSWYLTYLLNF